jgi:hypothetical protein
MSLSGLDQIDLRSESEARSGGKMRRKKTPREITNVLDFGFVEHAPIPAPTARSWIWLAIGTLILAVPIAVIIYLAVGIFS